MSYVLNSHTHKSTPNGIVNIDIIDKIDKQTISNIKYCTIGIHPWHADRVEHARVKSLLNNYKTALKIVAIGECGLDRVCKVNFEQQKRVFLEQLFYADECQLPVVIHSVRAWSDMFAIFKKHNKLTYILHDYRANIEQTKKLLEYQSYFSFGKSILNPTEKLMKTINIIPKDRVLIETDNETIDIEDIFASMQVVLNETANDLKTILLNNTYNAFNL